MLHRAPDWAAGSTASEWLLYRCTADNSQPDMPQNLTGNLEDNTIRLSWDAGSDDTTPVDALTYNLRLGTHPGANDVFTALSRTDGQRLVSSAGNRDGCRTLILNDLLPNTRYYWSVQCIDRRSPAVNEPVTVELEQPLAGRYVRLEWTCPGLQSQRASGGKLYDLQIFSRSDSHVEKGLPKAGKQVAAVPGVFRLYQNYPNPFNPETSFRYDLSQASPVEIDIYNTLGHRIQFFRYGNQSCGSHEVVWNGRNEQGELLPSGIYLIRLRAGRYVQTIKAMFLK